MYLFDEAGRELAGNRVSVKKAGLDTGVWGGCIFKAISVFKTKDRDLCLEKVKKG